MKFEAARNPAGHPRQKTAFFPEDFCKTPAAEPKPDPALGLVGKLHDPVFRHDHVKRLICGL